MALCCVAMVWHYVIIGIVVGAAIAVILLIFGNLG